MALVICQSGKKYIMKEINYQCKIEACDRLAFRILNTRLCGRQYLFLFFIHLFKIETGNIHLQDEHHHYYIMRLLIRMKMMTTTTTMTMMIMVMMMMTTIERVGTASRSMENPADKHISQRINISEIISLIFHHTTY